MGKGQRWKVVGGGGLVAREGFEDFSRTLAELLPPGAVVEEQELVGDALSFTRLSGRGPYSGWVNVRSRQAGDVLVRVEKRPVVSTAAVNSEPDLDGTAKRQKGTDKSKNAQPPAERQNAPASVKQGRFWKVVGAGPNGLVVRQGVSDTSPVIPGGLPQGAVVEQVQIVGNRLSFTDFSMRGPPSGWVNLRENGRDMLAIDTQGLSGNAIAEALKASGLDPFKSESTKATSSEPLSGWAKLSELYEKPRQKEPLQAAAAAETATDEKANGRRRRRAAPKELPPLEDLADASEEMLVDMLGFPEQEAKAFTTMSGASKSRVIKECRALIDMSPTERQQAFETLRKAWPQGPFPSFAKPSQNISDELAKSNFLPSGCCFPLKRVPDSAARMHDVPPQIARAFSGKPGSFFAKRPCGAPEQQKEALKALAAQSATSLGSVPPAEPSVAAERIDFCRLSDKIDRDKFAAAVIAKAKLSTADVAQYLCEEMKRRPVVQDAGPRARLRSAGLTEADYRGERLKVLRESTSQLGNEELLVLTKPNLVLDAHKEYLKAGADICCTNTLGANSLAQRDFKTSKLVLEMNKAAAQLAKKAAAEVTKQDPRKPRLVAGVIGAQSTLSGSFRSCSWDELVESYSEQVKGLAEGGVDLLSLEATNALSAKAAIYAVNQVYQHAKQKCPPLLVNVSVDESGRTSGGQTADAFFISVKHARPLAVSLSGNCSAAAVLEAHAALSSISTCFCGLMPAPETGQSPESFASYIMKATKVASGLPNLLGPSAAVLPTHIAALCQGLQAASTAVRALPPLPDRPVLQVAGHEACLIRHEDFKLIGGYTTLGSLSFKRRIDDYRATKHDEQLLQALKLCAAQCEKGADLLEVGVDAVATDGTAKGGKGVMSRFAEMCDADSTIGKVPLVLTSSEWRVIREGLRSTQGRCIVNGICLMLGEEEFIRIARECLKHGAAVVVLAIGEEGRAVTFKDKVAVCQKSYRLLRNKLDFPPEDIILDCHLQSLRPEEHPIDVINAISELKRTCPHASLSAGVNNLSASFGRLSMLREALHSTFLQFAIPKGLNLALADPGCLPVYSNLESETQQRCEEVVLHGSSSDEGPLKRFMAFLGFRSGSLVCLPLQGTGHAPSGPEAWWEKPECKEAAAVAQREYLQKRGKLASPQEQRMSLQTLKPLITASASEIRPDAGCARPDPCRVSSNATQLQQVSSALAARSMPPRASLLGQLNAKLQQKVVLLDGPGGPAAQLESIRDEASFRGADGRFPAMAKGNVALLSITKPNLVADAHRALLKAGAEIIRTNTLHGDAISQRAYGTEASTYELNKAAASLAKSVTAEVASQKPQDFKLVAGVIGPSSVKLSGPGSQDVNWDQLVQAYLQQVRGLVEGGVDLLMLDMVSDTLSAKAAIYAIEEHFAVNGQEKPPLVVNMVLEENGRNASGQSLEACWTSLSHAQPLAFGVSGPGAEQALARLAKLPCWSLTSGSAKFAGQVNLASPSSGLAQDVQQMAKAVAAASPRPLPPPHTASLQLSGLEAISASPDSLRLVGQRCNLKGSSRFRGLIDAYKYSKKEDCWEAAVEVCAQQAADEADIIDINLDSEQIDSQWAMGKFVRLCSAHPSASKRPFLISSSSWPVIAEGLKNSQGKCIVNGISMAMSEEDVLRLASECRRYGAAVVVVAISKATGDFPSYQEKVSCCQKAYQLLRSRLDFPAEDIIFDCILTPVGCEGMRVSVRDFIDAVAEVKRTCPGVSCIGGVSNLSAGFRTAKMLRQAFSTMFLQHAVPKGLNLALVELGQIPQFSSIEEPTKGMIQDVITHQAAEGDHITRLMSFAAFLSGAAAAEAAQKGMAASSSSSVKPDKSSVLAPIVPVKQPPEPPRPTPAHTHPIETLIQATGTVSASVFQAFGSKAHAASNYHRLIGASSINKTVHFSSISVYMGQGGSGPITGASGLMDGLTLWERHQGLNQYSTTVLWGAIGEIGLRKAIYGSRDVFAQFDLGQKLIGPADTAFLQQQVCCNPLSWDFIGLAYLDATWQATLSGKSEGSGGLAGRKTFMDNE